MSGIYGICEPGVQFQSHVLEPMSLSVGPEENQKKPPIGGDGALLGVSQSLNIVSLDAAYGSLVSVDADLRNQSSLSAEEEQASGRHASSIGELIAILYARHGLNFVERLEGAFSLALWDTKQQRLVLAIDRFGFKTLYWSYKDSKVLFSSRIGAITRMNGHSEVNPTAIMQLLIHTVVPAPLTIYQGIERLEPGTLLVYERGQIRREKYWDLNYEEFPGPNTQEYSQELRECMRNAVHSHLIGYQPQRTGAYLSGGTDSSSVVAFASEVYSPFNTFSIYFENPRYDEIGFARTASERFHARHHEKRLHASDVLEAIPKIAEFYEEPFANSSVIGAYHCARLAHESGVEMLLAGDGGDELFAGNERYATDKKFALYYSLHPTLRDKVVKPAAGILPQAGIFSLPARYIRRAEISNPRRMLSYSVILEMVGDDIFERDFLNQSGLDAVFDIAQAHFDSAPYASSELNRLLYVDVKMTLADNDLRKVLGSAELAGVHVRFPLLDRRVAELSGRIPSKLKLKGFEKRYIFKKAMKDILPERILYKKKHGFGVPVGHWMIHDPGMKSLVAVLDEPQTRQRGYFRPGFLARVQDLNREHPGYFGEALWILLMLELWHRRQENYSAAERPVSRVGTANAS